MATGDTLAVFYADSNFYDTATTNATPDTNADGLPCLDFDDAADEYAYFLCYMPGQYDGSSAITITLWWKFTTYVGSQTCDWEVSVASIGDDTDTVEALTYATAQVGLFTEAGTTGELDAAAIDLTNAQADSVGANEWFVVRVMRDSSGGTASPGDAELYGGEVQLQ